MKVVGIIGGIMMAALGGVIAYRAAFLAPAEAVVISDAGRVRELPDLLRIALGLVLLAAGAALAFLSARRPGPRA